MDDIDKRIVRELARQGRISNLDLADRIGLSPSACLRRTQELEKKGVIKGYRAILDADALGRAFVAYVAVGLNNHSKASQDAFEKAMSRTSAVTECHNVTGTVEYLLRVETDSLTSYKRFHSDVLGVLPQVNAITSYIVMASSKDERS